MTEPDPEGGAKSVISLTSAAIAALTAAATLVVIPGSIAMWLRLKHAGLPPDPGVIVSLPAHFLIAIGLTYVLFPLLALMTAAVVTVLVPGDEGQTNSVLRHPRQVLGHPVTEGWQKSYRWSTIAVVAFLVLVPAALIWAVGSTRLWLVIPLALLSPLICLSLSARIAENWKSHPDALSAVVLSAVVAAVIFTPWAIDFAVVRAAFPQATVCTSQGDRLEGPFVGETSDRVYIGEPPVRIVAAVRPRTENVLEDVLPADRYGLRFVPALTKGSLLGSDLAVADLGLINSQVPQPLSVPLVGYFHKPDKASTKLARQEGVKPVLLQRTFEQQLRPTINAALAHRSLVPVRGALEIASIPASQVTRIMIGGRASCPVKPAPGS